MQPQNKGPGMLWGQSYVLPMTWGGGGIWGAPFGRHAALRLFHFKKGVWTPEVVKFQKFCMSKLKNWDNGKN